MSTLGERIRKARRAAKLTQEDVADAFGIKRVSVTQWEGDITKPQLDRVPKLASILKTTAEQLLADDGMVGAQFAREVDQLMAGPTDLDVYAAVEGGDQSFVMGGVVDRVRRPSVLLHVDDGYAVIVVGESMIPAYRPGDIALVHPRLPPRQEDAVILMNEARDRATIKEYRSRTETLWKLRRYKPKEADMSMSRKAWPVLHTVVGKYNRR